MNAIDMKNFNIETLPINNQFDDDSKRQISEQIKPTT